MFLMLTFVVLFTNNNAQAIADNQKGRLPISTDEHQWLWGDSSDDTPVTNSLQSFNVTGKRISEIKCLEYVWESKCQSLPTSSRESCKEHLAKFSNTNGPFIVTGDRSASPGEYPHVGAIGWKTSSGTWIFKCGSILISPNFVVTAAHCTRSSISDTSLGDPMPKIVKFGHGMNAKNIEDIINITRIIVHPLYMSPKKYNDIALMQLERSVNFILPACLWSNPDVSVIGKQANLIGFNVITGEQKRSAGLHSALVDVVDVNTCSDLLRSQCNRLWCGVQSNQMCAGRLTGGVGSCQGDSGGPLQFGLNLSPTVEGIVYYVIGVISFGAGCARPNTPTILSNVTSFLPWIESIVWS